MRTVTAAQLGAVVAGLLRKQMTGRNLKPSRVEDFALLAAEAYPLPEPVKSTVPDDLPQPTDLML